MKIGIHFANVGPFANPEGAAQLAEAANVHGIDSLWTVEHVVVPEGYESPYPYTPDGKIPGPENSPIPDPLIWLAYMAGLTERVQLATGILILPQRNPLVVAKELATLDHLSGGRMVCGIGAGWLKEEMDAIGVPFADRGARTDDFIGALRALWSESPASYDGEFVSFERCHMEPKPVTGSIPIVVGGDSKPAARRAGRFGDGYLPGKVDGLEERIELMRSEAEKAGRDPEKIEVSITVSKANADAEKLAAKVGATQVILPSFMIWKDPVESLERVLHDLNS